MVIHTGRKDITILLTSYFALKPIYMWSSGTLQLADIVLIIGALYIIAKNRGEIHLESKSSSISKFLILLVFYQALVNLFWYGAVQHSSLLKSSTYYIFNFAAFFITLLIGEQCDIEDIKQAIAKGSFVSIIITMLGLALMSGTSRSTGFFNNPNQLGYYAVIMLTVLLYCQEYFSKLQKGILLVGAFWATIASLSKAAIIGAFGLLIVYLVFYQNGKSLRQRIIQFLLLCVVLVIIWLFFFSDNEVILNNQTLHLMRYRVLHMMEENDSNLGTGRGYDRVFELGVHFLWGMGEGAYSRFAVKTDAEVHATFVSILVSYGVLGFVGYIAFFWKCLVHKGLTWRNLTVMAGVFLYSLTHNGIRNTLLWILLAVLFLDRRTSDNTQGRNKETDYKWISD